MVLKLLLSLNFPTRGNVKLCCSNLNVFVPSFHYESFLTFLYSLFHIFVAIVRDLLGYLTNVPYYSYLAYGVGLLLATAESILLNRELSSDHLFLFSRSLPTLLYYRIPHKPTHGHCFKHFPTTDKFNQNSCNIPFGIPSYVSRRSLLRLSICMMGTRGYDSYCNCK